VSIEKAGRALEILPPHLSPAGRGFTFTAPILTRLLTSHIWDEEESAEVVEYLRRLEREQSAEKSC
jgi:hypothetical protein